MSSSKFSHRRAKPFKRRLIFFSSSVDAFFKILNLSAGNPMSLPSVSSRKIVLPSAHAFMAAGNEPIFKTVGILNIIPVHS